MQRAKFVLLLYPVCVCALVRARALARVCVSVWVCECVSVWVSEWVSELLEHLPFTQLGQIHATAGKELSAYKLLHVVSA
jgi:transposase